MAVEAARRGVSNSICRRYSHSVKDNGVVTTKVAYLAIGVDVEGRKHSLGCWIANTEGAKFWQKVLTDLCNRGVRDVLIAAATPDRAA